MFVVQLALAYVAAGIFVAVAFAATGAHRLLPGAPAISLGARVLLMPGAFLLWPLVLWRWLAVGIKPRVCDRNAVEPRP